MKGLFIPEMTVKKFRNECFELIEALMAEDEIFNIDYDPRHIPAIRDKLWEIQECSNCVLNPKKRIVETKPQWTPAAEEPKKNGPYIVTCIEKGERRTGWNIWVKDHWFYREDEPIAWMSLPGPYQGGDAE